MIWDDGDEELYPKRIKMLDKLERKQNDPKQNEIDEGDFGMEDEEVLIEKGSSFKNLTVP